MPEKIEWNDSYCLGVSIIDAQHKELISIINEFYDIVQEERDIYCSKMTDILKKLVDYTTYHFGAEETLLAKYGYPTVDFHKMQHTNFISELAKQAKKIENCKPEDGFKFYSYLLTWLINHIAKADKAWSIFVLPKMDEVG